MVSRIVQGGAATGSVLARFDDYMAACEARGMPMQERVFWVTGQEANRLVQELSKLVPNEAENLLGAYVSGRGGEYLDNNPYIIDGVTIKVRKLALVGRA